MAARNSGLFEDHISLKVENSRFHSDKTPDFLLYLMDLSYFSGKLEMYFRYRNFNFQRLEPRLSELYDIKKKTGTMQVPQVYDNRKKIWLRDTTYIIKYMEENYVSKNEKCPIYPSSELKYYISLLLEDFADEYMWRPAMYMRWEPKVDSTFLSTRFVWEFADGAGLFAIVPSFLRRSVLLFRQWLFSVFGEGIVNVEQHEVAKSQYYSVLNSLQEILEDSPYLFGAHPTIVDFGFLGPFFRHFSSDPTPRKIMQQQAPAVYEWIGRMWNLKDSKVSLSMKLDKEDEEIQNSLRKLFPFVSEYLKYLHQNALAWKSNQSSFDFMFKGGKINAVSSTVQTVPYRVWCRLELQRHFQEIEDNDEKESEKIKAFLKEFDCWDMLWKDGMIECPPEFGTKPPFCMTPKPSFVNDTPKWSQEQLILRYLKEHFNTMIIFSFLFFFILLLTIWQ